MKLLHSATLLLALTALACHSPDQGHGLPFSEAAYAKGKSDAQAELKKGHLALESFGYPASWSDLYQEMLKERYDIEDRRVAGCVIDGHILGHANGFNEVMEAEIHRRYGKDVFEKVSAEAQETYKKQHPEEEAGGFF
ncbi:MAG: hypothetical protein KDK99_04895 [Verrucomicrobiales bacterium]|nr:hypothetical protein [Verrucomicrobiales bacterium]